MAPTAALLQQPPDARAHAVLLSSASLPLSSCFAVQYTVFEQLKTRLLERERSKHMLSGRSSSPPPEALTAFTAFLLGAISKCVATVLTYPLIRSAFDPPTHSTAPWYELRKRSTSTAYGARHSERRSICTAGLSVQMQQASTSASRLRASCCAWRVPCVRLMQVQSDNAASGDAGGGGAQETCWRGCRCWWAP